MIGDHRIILIAAVDRNWAIGKDNHLLWHIPTDMKFFNDKTKGNIVVYGFNTLMSFPNRNILPNRDNIILTRKMIACGSDRMHVAHSIDDAINIIESFEDNRDVFICGGASVYHQFIDICDIAYITRINATADHADAFLVNLGSHPQWHKPEIGVLLMDEKSGLVLTFDKYVRNK